MMSVNLEDINKESMLLLIALVDIPEILFVSDADESCKVKRGHNMWFVNVFFDWFSCLQPAADQGLKFASCRGVEVNALAQGVLR